jgi:methionyl-tRNA formyltransferase
VHNNKNLSVVIFAFGFMGKYSLEGLRKNKILKIKGIIVPKTDKFYYSNIDLKKIDNKIKILKSDKKNHVFNFIKNLKPDVVLISTFNKIFEKKILKLSNFINIHHGRLPEQKGRASINWAILMGRNSIYLTFHQVVPKLDSGKIILQKKIDIKKYDNYQTIQNKIGRYIKINISKIILKYLQNRIKLKKNDSKKETWNCSRNPEDGLINFFKKKEDVHNLIRACKSKSFGAFCYLREKKIIILESSIKKNRKFEGIIPGRITQIYKNGSIDCLCKNGPITIKKIFYNNKIMKPSKIIKSTRDTLLND